MKYKLAAIVLCLVFFNTQKIKAQTEENCVKKGTFIIDAYYGFPYILGKYIKEASVSSSSSTNSKVANFNHIGGKFEFMLSKMVGLGFDYTFAKVNNSYTDTYYDNGSSVAKTGTFQSSLTKQRFLARVNIHFATSKVLDPYATAGVGYKVSLLKENNPNISQKDVDDFNTVWNIIPVAFRIGVGLRYYFIPNLGICAEAGIGGPAFQIGISGKF